MMITSAMVTLCRRIEARPSFAPEWVLRGLTEVINELLLGSERLIFSLMRIVLLIVMIVFQTAFWLLLKALDLVVAGFRVVLVWSMWGM